VSSLIPHNIEELVTEYKRIWPLMPRLHAAASKLAEKDAIKACGKKLGLYSKHGTKPGLVFEHEYEAETFQDYLNYMYRPRGFSLVRLLCNRKRYPEDSDEQQLLEQMVKARFSLFWIRELHPAGGFVALDVVTGEDFFILDQSLPQQDVVGLLSAFRIFPFRGVWMHTGANMSFGCIEDPEGLHPLNRHLDDKEEDILNRENFFRWRELMRDQA